MSNRKRLAIAAFLIANIFFISLSATALSYGARGEQVRQVQTRLIYLGYLRDTADGIFGSKTRSAVVSFQRDKGLAADGVVGAMTLKALALSSDLSWQQIKQVQQKLAEKGLYSGKIDGVYGALTANAISEFQQNAGLRIDGIAGKETFKALGLSEPAAGPTDDTEINLLARIISAESRGESYEGQVAVGAVIVNRISHPSFPSSLSGVIYQPGAFTAIVDGQFDQPISESAYRAARDALSGIDPTGGAIYYYNPSTATNVWIRSRQIVKQIGKHVFCL